MHEIGTVIRMVGRKVDIRVDQQTPEACAKCRACQAFGEGGQLVLRVTTADSYQSGQRVAIEVPEISPWVGIVWVLGLPVVMLVIGLLVGANWPAWQQLLHVDAELAGALLGLLLGGVTFFIARQIERHYACRIHVRPLTQPGRPM